MKYLLDTDTCIYILRAQPAAVGARFRRLHQGAVGVPSIVVAELAYGAAKSGSTRNRERLELFLLPLEVVPFDLAAAHIYGDLRAALDKRGTPIGPLDLLIAAQAVALDLMLVSNNEREFRRVPGLRVENWTAA